MSIREHEANINKWPLFLFLANIILMFGRPMDIVPVLGSLKLGLIVALSLIWIWLKSDQRHYDLKEKEIKANFFLILICALSFLWSENIGATFGTFQNQIMYIFGFTLAAMLALKNESNFVLYLKIWLVINAYIAITVILSGGRGTGGVFGDENDVGAALVMVVPYFFYSAMIFKNKTWQLFCYAGLLVCLVAIVYTGSRGAMLGVVAVFAVIFYFSKYKMKFLFYGATVAIVAVSFFVSDGYLDEVQSINDTEDDTRVERLYSWGIGVDMLVANPIFGVGGGQYPWAVCNYQPEEDVKSGIHNLCGRASHSTYIEVISEYGLVGILLFYIILNGIFKKLLNIKRIMRNINNPLDQDLARFIAPMSSAVFVSIVGFLVSGTFISLFYYPFLWLQIGVAIALSRYVDSCCVEKPL